MRKVLALVALSAACDGGVDNNPPIDAAVVDMADAYIPDAPASIDGMWQDTFHTAAGPMMVSSCGAIPPSAIQVDSTTAATTVYGGTCKPDGSFRIEAPGSLGLYYLKVGSTLHESNKRGGIDLSGDRLGRNDVAGITGVTLGLALTNMQPWVSGDLLVAFSANIGYRQNLSFTTGAPSPEQSSVTATAPWNGYKIDGSKSDTLHVVHLGKHTTGSGLDYFSLDEAFEVPSFTMTNNTHHAVAGAFGHPTASSIDLSIDVASFHQFAPIAAPAVTQAAIQGSAYAAVSTDTVDSPSLVSFAQLSDGVSVMNFDSLPYRDPFPISWERFVKVQVGLTVSYMWNGITGTRVATIDRVMSKATADGTPISAQLGPPTDVRFDGDDALTDTNISPVPVVTWSAPSVGTPTDYELQVFEAKTLSGSLTFTPILRLTTKQTAVRIPAGYLYGQRQYVFSVRARQREGVDIYTNPLRLGASWSSAEMLSALVTTDS
jgi:hypothetical protein